MKALDSTSPSPELTGFLDKISMMVPILLITIPVVLVVVWIASGWMDRRGTAEYSAAVEDVLADSQDQAPLSFEEEHRRAWALYLWRQRHPRPTDAGRRRRPLQQNKDR